MRSALRRRSAIQWVELSVVWVVHEKAACARVDLDVLAAVYASSRDPPGRRIRVRSPVRRVPAATATLPVFGRWSVTTPATRTVPAFSKVPDSVPWTVRTASASITKWPAAAPWMAKVAPDRIVAPAVTAPWMDRSRVTSRAASNLPCSGLAIEQHNTQDLRRRRRGTTTQAVHVLRSQRQPFPCPRRRRPACPSTASANAQTVGDSEEPLTYLMSVTVES